ncbi:2-C-methyl-D-erythritol 4-phosphate cytidylyltransferase [Pedobacter changchengzhani]|uniref:2-C-methyl-D-erythritol 4-phosphate cytidylyltransferase n=1 Tax=Pedobacter changchengzhani TaxID=2529274 RepID=A0A4R5MKI0_9SPHI|nr:2-C-methyl-D-erythritol 4-phosphate cytidylyltransferase [Pedobacter changchengzhani]TDG35916.1 2-C-methyl-D-erythritol 4-phosphate cytidylyltransferase [Pedobacter changchengzhani]
MKYYAIIVAGGSGTRMQTEKPKQFLLLNNLPVLMHTIKAFHQNQYCPKIILVLAQDHLALWQQLIIDHQFQIPHQIIEGGSERFYSVKNGLSLIDDKNAVVAIHDAVRPLTSQKTINLCFETATSSGNAIASVGAKDSIRRLLNGKSAALDRKEIYLVQTPQTFQIAQLRKAYQQEYDAFFTDDASVVEKAGYQINLVAGDEFNFKITYKEDLILAETILKTRS